VVLQEHRVQVVLQELVELQVQVVHQELAELQGAQVRQERLVHQAQVELLVQDLPQLQIHH
jgi:hypothetical protein